MPTFYCKNTVRILTALATMGSIALTGCVDNDYDLSKDIDKNVTIGGGELRLPASSTSEITMESVLNLDRNSSIRAINQEDINSGLSYGLELGDYVLIQNGDRTETDIKVEQVRLNDIHPHSDETCVPFVPGGSHTLPADFTANIDLAESNVSTDLRSLTSAKVDLEMTLDVKYRSDVYHGSIIVNEGYTITFDKNWTIEIADPATASYATVTDGHVVTITKAQTIGSNSHFRLALKVSEFKFKTGELQPGDGLYAPGHFNLDSKIDFKGNVTAVNPELYTLGDVFISADFNIPSVTLLAVTGKVDPKIDIKSTNVEISDIPDFLDSEDNNLDLANPQIYFTVSNSSPVSADVTALLRGTYTDKSKAPVDVYIGQYNDPNIHGTERITVGPGETCICLSRTGEGFKAPDFTGNFVNIAVPDINNLLATIPDNIEISDIDVKVVQDDVTFVLSKPNEPGYRFSTDYEAVVPLAFGSDLCISYEDSDDGWDEDLEKYSFGSLHVDMNVCSTVPITLTPEIELIDRNGNAMTNVTVSVDGSIIAGSLLSPATSQISLVAECKDGSNLNGVYGIRYKFTAVDGETTPGVHLNERQGLKFENIKIYLLGGVTVNLDD